MSTSLGPFGSTVADLVISRQTSMVCNPDIAAVVVVVLVGGNPAFCFIDSIQHLEQKFPVASLPKKPQSILQRVGVAGGFDDDCSDIARVARGDD